MSRHGLSCPTCGARSAVLSKREVGHGDLRRRVCENGHRFGSVEVVATERGRVPKPVREAKVRQPAPLRTYRRPADVLVTNGHSTYGLDRDERKHLRELFERWKFEHGVGSTGRPLAESPVLRAAFYRFLVDHGYGYVDLAEITGLSRERVRQLANAMGIHAPGVAMRRWDAEASRFVAVTAVELIKFRAAARKRSREMRRLHATALRWDEAVQKIRAFEEREGRAPVAAELAELLGLQRSVSYLLAYIAPSRDKTMRMLDDVYRMAGVAERPDGRSVKAALGISKEEALPSVELTLYEAGGTP